MKNIWISFFCGIIFSLGLVISGMTNPDKVIGFLDIFGAWDPSLAFVMGGAVLVNLVSFKLILKRKPYFADKHLIPSNSTIDKKLIVGSVFFGIGWGLIGICPGPAIANLITFDVNLLVFLVSLIVGMLAFRLFETKCK